MMSIDVIGQFRSVAYGLDRFEFRTIQKIFVDQRTFLSNICIIIIFRNNLAQDFGN